MSLVSLRTLGGQNGKKCQRIIVKGSTSDGSASLSGDWCSRWLSVHDTEVKVFNAIFTHNGKAGNHMQAVYSTLFTLPVFMRPRIQRVIDTLTLVTECSILIEEKNPSRANLLAE